MVEMNKRKLLLGLAATALPIPAMAKKDGLLVVYNKLGIPCYYTRDLADDLMASHNLDVKQIFEDSYGTYYSIEKEFISEQYLGFTLRTDDPRDRVIRWLQKIETDDSRDKTVRWVRRID